MRFWQGFSWHPKQSEQSKEIMSRVVSSRLIAAHSIPVPPNLSRRWFIVKVVERSPQFENHGSIQRFAALRHSAWLGSARWSQWKASGWFSRSCWESMPSTSPDTPRPGTHVTQVTQVTQVTCSDSATLGCCLLRFTPIERWYDLILFHGYLTWSPCEYRSTWMAQFHAKRSLFQGGATLGSALQLSLIHNLAQDASETEPTASL